MASQSHLRCWRGTAPLDEKTDTHYAHCRARQGRAACIVTLLVGLTVSVYLRSGAQERRILGVDPLGRPGTPPPELPTERPSPLPPRQVLPPLPPPTPGESQQLPGPRIFVRRIEVTGSTVFSQAKLATVTADYENW